MKSLFVLLILFITNTLYSQCDDCKDIKREYDNFDNKYIVTISAGKLSGGNFIMLTNATLQIQSYQFKNDTINYFVFTLVSPNHYTFLDNEISLVFKCDTTKFSFKTSRSNTVFGKDYNIYTIYVKFSWEQFFNIINSKEVMIRTYTLDGYTDRDYSFDEDYFSCFKCFYKTYLKK
jgi:hypothetical protein